MITYNEYLDKHPLTLPACQPDLTHRDDRFLICCGADPLLTPMGNLFAHDSERMAQLLATGLAPGLGTSGVKITPVRLFAFQKDVYEVSGDPYPGRREQLLASDPLVTVKATGRFNFQPFSPDDELFSFAFTALSSLIRSINAFVAAIMHEIILEDNETAPFPEILKYAYTRLVTEEKVVLQAWSAAHGSGVVLPLLLVTGNITPSEYVNGLVALRIASVPDRERMLLDIIGGQDYISALDRGGDGRELLSLLRRQGESDSVEFKSTLRWDIRAGKTNPAIERASLKTMAAFLNSAGGTLLIGVRDDGTIEGIESDKFANEDKFLLHLWTLIRTCLGREVSPYLRTTLEKVGELTVCNVQCRQSPRPVFLRQPGYDEAFYIRLGPSTNAMDISEALKYITDHFTV